MRGEPVAHIPGDLARASSKRSFTFAGAAPSVFTVAPIDATGVVARRERPAPSSAERPAAAPSPAILPSRIVGTGPAAWLAVWPAALDGFPDELDHLQASGASPAELDALRRHHGIESGRQR